MTLRVYFKLSLFLPLAITAILYVATLNLPDAEKSSFIALAGGLHLLAAPGLLIIGLVSVIWFRKRRESFWLNLTLLYPVINAFFMPVMFGLYAAITSPNGEEPETLLRGGLVFSIIAIPFALVIGYIYVAIIFFVASLLKKRGWLKTEAKSL